LVLDASGVVTALSLTSQPTEALVRTPNQPEIVEQLSPSSSLDANGPSSLVVLLAVQQTDGAANPADIQTTAARKAVDQATALLLRSAQNIDPQTTASQANVLDASVRPSPTPQSIELFMLAANSRMPSSDSGPTSPRFDRPLFPLSSTPVEPGTIDPLAEPRAPLPSHRAVSTGDPRNVVVLGPSALELSRLASLGMNGNGDYLLVIPARIAHAAMLAAEKAANHGKESEPQLQAVTDEVTTSLRSEVAGDSETLHSAMQLSDAQDGPRSLPKARPFEDVAVDERKSSESSFSALRERNLSNTAAVLPPAPTEEAQRSGRGPSGELSGAKGVRESGESGTTPGVTEAEVAGDALPAEAEPTPTRVALPEPPGSPKGADLLTEFTPKQLRALEATMQKVGEQLQTVARQPRGMLFWAGISCACLTAAAVAVGISRRRQSALRLLSEQGAGDSFLALDSSDELLIEDEV
jgi:hypothetical protein